MPSPILGEAGLMPLRVSLRRTVTRSWHSLGLKAELAPCRKLDLGQGHPGLCIGQGHPGPVIYPSSRSGKDPQARIYGSEPIALDPQLLALEAFSSSE